MDWPPHADQVADSQAAYCARGSNASRATAVSARRPRDAPTVRLPGDWELNEALLFRAHLEQGSTVVDIGAHVGYYTLLSARAVGARGRVIAIEPDPDNAALAPRERPQQWAAERDDYRGGSMARDHPLHLRRDPINTGANRIILGDDGHDVAAVALDEQLAGLPVSLVKVDAQGTDHIALQGMRQTLIRCRPVVFTEFWPQGIREFGDDPVDAIDGYRQLGFRITMIGFETDFASWSGQEIVDAAERLPLALSKLT